MYELFLLPPYTETQSPRFHHRLAFERPEGKPQAVVSQPAQRAQCDITAAKRSLTAADTKLESELKRSDNCNPCEAKTAVNTKSEPQQTRSHEHQRSFARLGKKGPYGPFLFSGNRDGASATREATPCYVAVTQPTPHSQHSTAAATSARRPRLQRRRDRRAGCPRPTAPDRTAGRRRGSACPYRLPPARQRAWQTPRAWR